MSKICKYCKTEIPDKAKYCPNCQKKLGIPKGLFVFIFFIIIVIAVSTSNDSDKVSNDNSEKKTNKFSYTIDNVESSSYAYYIEGSVINNRNRDYSYVQIEFICYDSNGNNLGTALDNTNNLLSKQSWKYKAMFMGSNSNEVDHCDFHEVTGW